MKKRSRVAAGKKQQVSADSVQQREEQAVTEIPEKGADMEKEAKVKAQMEEKEQTAFKEKVSPAAAKAIERKTSMIVQYGDLEIDADVIRRRVEEDFVAGGHRLGAVVQMDIYIKPEEGMAYYVASGKRSQTKGQVSLYL